MSRYKGKYGTPFSSYSAFKQKILGNDFVSFIVNHPVHTSIQDVPKKKGISECYSFSFSVYMIWSLEYSLLTHLKIDIHRFVPSTKQFLSDIWELRNIFSIIKFVCS